MEDVPCLGSASPRRRRVPRHGKIELSLYKCFGRTFPASEIRRLGQRLVFLVSVRLQRLVVRQLLVQLHVKHFRRIGMIPLVAEGEARNSRRSTWTRWRSRRIRSRWGKKKRKILPPVYDVLFFLPHTCPTYRLRCSTSR